MCGMAPLRLGGLLGRERYSLKDVPLPALAFTQTRELGNEPQLPSHLRHLIWWWCWGGEPGGVRREALARSLRSSPSESASFPRHVPRRKRGGSGGAGSRSPSHKHTQRERGRGVCEGGCAACGDAARAPPVGVGALGDARGGGWMLPSRRMRAPSAP